MSLLSMKANGLATNLRELGYVVADGYPGEVNANTCEG